MITEAEKLVANGPQQMNNLCLGGFASKNCLSSYKFGKKVAKMLQAINDLISKGVFDKVAESQPAASVVVRPEERPIALQPTIEKVWNCIVDKDVGIIGLYGLGGVGKTTLLTQIKFCTTANGLDVVIWALLNPGRISVEEKAVDIYGVLRIKRFVVLLDDLWERVDLNQVGIPKPSQDNGSKLIFTTRYLELCGEMEAREKIKVECLEPKDAWKLFQDKVGDETLNSHPNIRKLAKQVVERCGGLPLALITIGRAMACKTTPGDWKYAIEMLKRCSLPKMENEVFPLLKFSYDNLPNVTMKCCLLYCCLYPEDYCIPKKRLVEYWFCEGMLNEFDRISEAQMQGDYIISSLLNALCELEAKENKFFVKAGAQLFEEPDIKIWECAKRMSVMKNNIEVIIETPKCPNLHSLFLSENKLKVINYGFFQFIPHLTVLNLSNSSALQVLPRGISQLISLECLDLSHTAIRELAIELKSLTKLKMLDLSCIPYLRRIPRNLISSFSRLQIFRITSLTSEDYPEEDNVLNGGNENLIEELKSLQHLNTLSMLPLTSMFALERSLSFNLFRCCTQEFRLSGFKESKCCLQTLNLRNCENVEEIKMEKLHTWVSPGTSYTSPFYTLTSVSFQDCHKLTDVTWLILVPNLRYLGLVQCVKIEEILSQGKFGEVADVRIPYPIPFLKLEKLVLCSICPELKKLPLNSDSAKGNRITIDGNEDWWAEIEWENEATRQTFSPFFRSYS
ncbi:hypothetical protein ES288_A06G227200v1 [Gossypium darwinii]|uniref:NB-ARC domain-containing protein n=1 Tax=Gossypium darwinii TaxID=34276 RepID=A0A5D2GAZ6_GOSDA|nr:hypothetical protein ES288_A06G227200v1 [Gossypium darwinii]